MDVIDIASDDDPAADSSDESGSGSEADEVDRKRLKILNKMMPAVMIQKMTAAGKARKAARAEREREQEREAAGEELEEPLKPGQSRRRIGSRRSVEILGDSESEDDDVDMRSRSPSSGPRRYLSDEDEDVGRRTSDADVEVIEPIGHQPRPKYRPGHISVSDGDPSSDSEDDDVDLAVGRWVLGAPTKPKRRVRDDGVVKERDMIDRMLSRTSGNSRRRRKWSGMRRHGGGGHRTGGGGGGGGGRRRRNGDIRDYGVFDGGGGDGGGGGSGGHRGTGGGGGEGQHVSRGHGGPKAARQADGLRITTTGAKRYGAGQQTLLTFPRRSTPGPEELMEVDSECMTCRVTLTYVVHYVLQLRSYLRLP